MRGWELFEKLRDELSDTAILDELVQILSDDELYSCMSDVASAYDIEVEDEEDY